ncbi:MAG TPA: BON domain-containing protein [Methylotenera sp.]
MKAASMKLSAFTLVCLIGLTACDNPNTGEDAGKKMDQAVANAEVKMGETSDKMGEASDKAGDNVADATITTKIKAAFLAESVINSMDINVTTKDGVVTLTGSADSLASSKKAEEIARVVSEVKQVNNQLVIK